MKAPSYEAATRQRAKEEGLVLVTFDCDARHAVMAEADGLGRLTIQGALPPAVALEMMRAVQAIHKRFREEGK
jgi:TRAP-type C4-dicarboxylate transport system permease small subunit